MHRVFQIPEVLLNIFCRYVSSGRSVEDRESDNRDLATLARTCRAFKEPALDILWIQALYHAPEISYQTSVTGYFVRWFQGFIQFEFGLNTV